MLKTSPNACNLSSKGAVGSLTSRLQRMTVSAVRQPAPRIVASYGSPPSLEGVAPAKYAIIEVGGHQKIVEEGQFYTCNRLQVAPGSVVKFPRVLAVKENGDIDFGRPYLENATVEAEITEELKGPKALIYKYKPKKHYRRKVGHRQPLTKFKITKIAG